MGADIIRGVLGIDTSCYTTSVAFASLDGRLLAQKRQLLPVKPGERGLRQGDAFFLHGRQLPHVMEALFADLRCSGEAKAGREGLRVEAVAASTRPRPEEGAYLPVFLAGEAVGRSVAAAQGVPFFATTHQEGHIMAGIASLEDREQAEALLKKGFLSVHLSGGTTELLRVRFDGASAVFSIEKLGATTDLHAGQLVDRVGVALGLPFPAGPHLEALAAQCDGGRCAAEGAAEGSTEAIEAIPFPASVKGYNVSFSGAEAQALRLIEKWRKANEAASPAAIATLPGDPAHPGIPALPAIARGIEGCLASTLEKILRRAIAETGCRDVLIVGGVAANGFLRRRLRERLEHRAVGGRLAFATTALSGDNAAGVALLGAKFLSASMACR
ncbi:o-sialoglycoprotein endopeptidase, putative [Heliomicrobium modesticaldum Ice1]|uniref:N(6)-L-threonylcarbamoyladenine synthase n=1 Tax=Heliobacterium modesticaldum (strain ATCC 51547 / Ice1) TaxID=498761 RepID=B0TEI7_HELMI|nr:O-sialoglycoprotein endopeptidase [Heliomicrobium modesticaldum]ABZ82906.1 o-sialoglycoprotein endopeptidase, putative [Heliomicrobium modesticaldum Ice1]